MVGLRRVLSAPLKPFVSNRSAVVPASSVPRAVALAEPASRDRVLPGMTAVGVSGVVHYGGQVYGRDYDNAWNGDERDRTIQHMLNDPVIGACLTGIEMLIRRVDWRVDAPDDSTEANEVADFYRDCLARMSGFWPGETMSRILTYLGWGWSALGVQYRRRDDGRVGWEAWDLIPQFTRWGWEFDTWGKATGLIQLDPMTFKEEPIKLSRCIVFRYGSRDNSPEGNTPLRQVFDAWYRKTNIQVIEGIGIERDLSGLPVMRIPSRDIDNNTPTNQAAQNIVTNVRQDAMSGLVIASDRDDKGNHYQEFELVSTAGARAIDTDPIVRRYANEMVTVFLANVMRTGQDGTGSYALADVQGGLFQQAIGAHLDTIGDAITSQEFPRLARFNGIDPRLVPTLKHGDVENTDLARLGTYLVNLANAGLLADTPELRSFVHKVAELPVPTPEEMEAQQAEEKQAAQTEQARQDALKAGPETQTAQPGQEPDSAADAPTQPVRTVAKGDKPEPVKVTLSDDDIADAQAWFDARFPQIAGVLGG